MAEQVLENAEELIDDLQRDWLGPLGPIESRLHRALYIVNRGLVRSAFRFQVEGIESVPVRRPLIFAPNHGSSLDAPLLAAALPYSIAEHTHWAGRKGRVLMNRVVRFVNRVVKVIPIDRDVSGLAAGAAVLRRGNHLVWFPEGTRTRDGELQEFRFGVGALARHFEIPVVPVGIDGAHQALPPGARFPRLRSTITVRFGEALSADDARADGEPTEANQQVADELRDRVAELI